MRKYRKDKRYRTLVVFSLLIVLVTMSAGQAFTSLESTESKKVLPDGFGDPQPLGDPPYYEWEDDFTTLAWVDPDIDKSYDYELKNGKIQIKNTYEVWTEPASAWSRLKPITLTNNVGQTLNDFAINLIVDYDGDMQEEYQDIRFKHANDPNTWLDYWIETKDSSEASVWVKLTTIPTGQSNMYLFYGNPNADDESDFYSVFTEWEEKEPNDIKISIKMNTEGAWDADVAYGSASGGRYLVSWEEGTVVPVAQEIRGSLFDSDGDAVIEDFDIFEEAGVIYHNEDPSAAYGGGKFFVTWESWYKYTPTDPTTKNILGRFINPNTGATSSVINVCFADERQQESCVVFDDTNDQFCVVWEDAREGVYNYDIYGQLYDTNGNRQLAQDGKALVTQGNSQVEPWITYDNVNDQYMLVWEDGETPNNGPFDIWARRFDSDLNGLGSAIKLADGDDDTDYNFPCVAFCEATELFLVTWNDGDISDDDWYGNVWGCLLDDSGSIVQNNIPIKSGNYIRTDIVPYLTTSFFVSFNGGGSIWGKLVSSNGNVFADDVKLSASTSAVADWANMAVGSDQIFVVWEDERNDLSSYPDAYGNMWHLNIPTGNEVMHTFGTEKRRILEAQITSKPIEPDNLAAWYEFFVNYDGTITFDVLDETGDLILIPEAGNGEDLSGIDPEIHKALRLRAFFERDYPSYTPTLDSWKIVYIGYDEVPPETTVREIIGSNPKPPWYTSNVKILLDVTDGQYGSYPITTYFKIDNGDEQVYDSQLGIRLPQHATGDSNTPYGEWDVYYWSIDNAGNIEDANGPVSIQIDKAPPICEIIQPADRATVKGDFLVKATATDVGSGIEYVLFDTGPPYEDPFKDYTGNPYYEWECTRHVNWPEWKHIIAQAYDYAGNEPYEYNIYVRFVPSWWPDSYVYSYGSTSSSSSSSTSSTSSSSTSSSSSSTPTSQSASTTTQQTLMGSTTYPISTPLYLPLGR